MDILDGDYTNDKEKRFRELLLEEGVKFKTENIFNRSLNSDEEWKKIYGNKTRVKELLESLEVLNKFDTYEHLEVFGDKYDHVYEILKDEEERKMLNKPYVISDIQNVGFSHHTTIKGLFDMLQDDHLHHSGFTEDEILKEKHRLKLFSVQEKENLLRIISLKLMNLHLNWLNRGNYILVSHFMKTLS